MKMSDQMELAIEAVDLIKQFKNETSNVIENTIKQIEVNGNGSIIVVEDIQGDKLEYTLSRVTRILNKQFDGIVESASLFYSNIEIAKLEVESKLGEISKEEFVQVMGKICYAECIGEKVYTRLKEIESTAKKNI